jgi:tripartite-type tricarboxylate transporter receptor subunit TctC
VSKATQDTIGGTLHVVIESFSGLSGPIKSGLLRPLAVASDKRVAEFADIPTVAEAIPGVQDFEARGWFALMAPAGTPPPILRKVSDDVRQVLSEPELQAKFASLGTFTRLMPETGVAAYIRKEQALWLPIVKRLNASH